MSDLVLKDKDGAKQTYSGVTKIKIKNSDGSFETFSKSSGTKTIEKNGLYDVAGFEKVDVQVSNSGGGETKLYKFNDSINIDGYPNISEEVFDLAFEDVFMTAKSDSDQFFIVPVLVTDETNPSYYQLIVFKTTEPAIGDGEEIYNGTNTEIDTNNLSGLIVEIVNEGLFSEWLKSNTTPLGGGTATELYKFNDTIDENGSFEFYEGLDSIPDEDFRKGMEIKNITVTVEGESAEIDSAYLYPAIINVVPSNPNTGAFVIYFYGADIESGEMNGTPLYIHIAGGEPAFSVDKLTFEIVNYGQYESWFKSNISPVGGGGECSGVHINIVDELPENGVEGAFYGVNGAFIYLVLGDEGSGILDLSEYMGLPDGKYMFIRTNSEEIQDMPAPDGITNGCVLCYTDDIPEMYIGVIMSGRWLLSPLPLYELFEGYSYKGEITDTAEATEDGYYMFTAPSQICQFLMHERRDFVKKGVVRYEDYEGDISKAAGISRYHDENIIIQSTSPNSGYPVTEIDYGAFGDALIRSVTIPNSVEKIGQNAFRDCVALESIDFPDKNIEFGGYAFASCYSLRTVTIGEGQGGLSEDMFDSCTRLAEIYLPSSLTDIRSYAFNGCTNLTKITFGGTVEQWQSVTFGYNWNRNVPATKVVCSDGEVRIGAVSFTIDGTLYYADQGMLWWEWIDSEYNTDSRYIRMEGDIWDTQTSQYVCLSNGGHVGSAAEIKSGTAYTLGD